MKRAQRYRGKHIWERRRRVASTMSASGLRFLSALLTLSNALISVSMKARQWSISFRAWPTTMCLHRCVCIMCTLRMKVPAERSSFTSSSKMARAKHLHNANESTKREGQQMKRGASQAFQRCVLVRERAQPVVVVWQFAGVVWIVL